MSVTLRDAGRLRPRHGPRLLAAASCMVIMLPFTGTTQAGAVDDATYRELHRLATEKRFTAIQVNLDTDISIRDVASPRRSQQVRIAALDEALMRELAGKVLPSSIWRNGIGQLGLYASASALPILQASANVRSFAPDTTRSFRSSVHDSAGEVAKIESELRDRGFADVELIENLDNFEFEIQRDGSVRHLPSAESRAEMADKRAAFHRSLLPRVATPMVQDQAAGEINSTPFVRLRVSDDGFRMLMEHPYVRAIRRANAPVVPATPVRLDPEALAEAEARGSASVIIDLRRFAEYSALKGKLPARAWQSQAAALRKAFGELLDPVEPGWRSAGKLHDGIASLAVNLSAKALRTIYATPDARVAAITLNKPVAVAMLKESVAQMNLPNEVWAKHTTGAGQSIAILDTGVDRDHPFLQSTITGTSKVWAEGCFGTNTTEYSSLCDTLDPSGDRFGVGSGRPLSSSLFPNQFMHGTHVAGIAAGAGGLNGMSGVAPGARLISAQVFSGWNYGGGTARVSPGDVAEALNQIALANDPNITVNMSIGLINAFDRSEGACNSTSLLVTDNVAKLVSMRIPVVASTANDGLAGKIYWLSCVSRVIKVGAVDDLTGKLWPGSNLPDPEKFADPFFLAPGSVILSSVPGRSYEPLSGTSMAAPHVAGLYALGKSAWPTGSVADLTAWFQANATVAVTDIPMGVLPPQRSVTLYRIRVRDNL